jgi:hypothetical protein
MNKKQDEKARTSIGKYLASLTKRQLELFIQDCAMWDYFEPLDHESAAELAKSKLDYEKALYGTCAKSEKKQEAFHFLRVWIGRTIWAEESGRPRPAGKLLRLLTPRLDACDAEFFDGLAEAMRILATR